MRENGARHVYNTLWKSTDDPRRHRGRIEENMQISSKSLGPNTDQGQPVQYMTTEEVADWLRVARAFLPAEKSTGVRLSEDPVQ